MVETLLLLGIAFTGLLCMLLFFGVQAYREHFWFTYDRSRTTRTCKKCGRRQFLRVYFEHSWWEHATPPNHKCFCHDHAA